MKIGSTYRKSPHVYGFASAVLVGLVGAAACSGNSGSSDPSAAAGADAGPASQGSEAQALENPTEVARRLGARRETLSHLVKETSGALRKHESLLLPQVKYADKPFLIGSELGANAKGEVRIWPIGDKERTLRLQPKLVSDVEAELTDDGRAVFKGAYGDADLIESVEQNQWHHTVVIKNGRAPSLYKWDLTIPDGLHPVVLDDSSVVMVDSDRVAHMKVSAATLVDDTGKEKKLALAVQGNQMSLYVNPKTVEPPAALDFSVSVPNTGEQFAAAPTVIKGRMMVLLDTSGSMIFQFDGSSNVNADGDDSTVYCDNDLGNEPGGWGTPAYTFDCSLGLSCSRANGGRPDWELADWVNHPSRLYAAKQALTNVVTAHAGLLDFGLTRFRESGSCNSADPKYCCEPASTTDTTDRGRCVNLDQYYTPSNLPGSRSSSGVYAGSCGSQSGGGRVLVPPAATSADEMLLWTDQIHNICDDGSGGQQNPEVRGSGSTPLARAIRTVRTDWYDPIYDVSKPGSPNYDESDPLFDALIDCRSYVTVIMSDGADTCGNSSDGDPSETAQVLHDVNDPDNPVLVYAMGMADASASSDVDLPELNQVGIQGGSALYEECTTNGDCGSNCNGNGHCACTGNGDCSSGFYCTGGECRSEAPLAQNQNDIEAAFGEIVSRTVKFEVCNDADDNCNNLIDEGLGVYEECVVDGDCGSGTCDQGRCTCTTTAECSSGNRCSANGYCKPDCVAGVGECQNTGVRKCDANTGESACCEDDGSATCTPLSALTPGTEVCNGLDDDCNGIIDDVPGGCQGCNPVPETCNGLDDDCNGIPDDNPVDVGQACGSDIGECSPGTTVCNSGSLDCNGGTGPTTEVCDGLDNNCDGIVDGMSRACYTGPGGTQGVGVCRAGTQQCTATAGSGTEAWGSCVGETLPGTETCNGLDDDCNGTTDDVANLGNSCCPLGSCGVGICQAGTLQCSGGSLQCIGDIGPGTEVCNGEDDDCNGTVDDVSGLGGSCCPSGKCGTGVCAAGTLQCQGTTFRCVGATNPSAETCNGLDDDCNGLVDDLPGAGSSCCPPGVSCGIGVCTTGTLSCNLSTGNLECSGFQGPGTEVCDGDDNDCNGAVDDVSGAGDSCCNSGLCGTGICTAGVQQCVGSSLECVGEVMPKTEVCDTIDNDCNGTVDDVTGVGNACCAYQDGNGNDLCGVGVCASGSLQCVSGNSAPVCVGGQGPSPEQCNGVDDDCNGIVDDLPGGTPGDQCCPSGLCGIGVCATGTLGCGSNGLECQNAVGPSAEICDNLDNDCDGNVDDLPGEGNTCCPAGVPCGTGICTSGTLSCVSGEDQLQCTGYQGPETEVCDGKDRDCNGVVDDPTGSGDSCCPYQDGSGNDLCGTGICKAGVRQCVGSSLECVGATGPKTEVCNQVDDDCDGQVDNLPSIGQTCCAFQDDQGNDLCGVGICGSGTVSCVAGKTAPQCTGGNGPIPEVCDGLDNDCNGTVDDLPGGTVGGTCCPSGKCGTGVCQAGQLTCGSNGLECQGAVNPSGETCDGLDNDCNGQVDDVPGLGTTCCPSGLCGRGECKSGVLACTASGIACQGAVGPVEEVCDGLDNDCNGIVDDIPGQGEPCCPDGSDAPDGCNQGICRPGVVACVDGEVGCRDAVEATDETCNGKDDDCDGTIDEDEDVSANDPEIGVECDAPEPPNDQPPCAPGTTICQGGKPVCDGAVGPGKEVCDGEDNDCDGVADQGSDLCDMPKACFDGVCRSPCGRGEFPCPGGFSCRSGYCVPTDSSGSGGSGGTGAGGSGATTGAGGSGATTGAGGSGATTGAGGTGTGGSGTGATSGAGGNGTGGSATGGTSGSGASSGQGGNGVGDGGPPGSGSGAQPGSGAQGGGQAGSASGAGGSGSEDFYGLATGGGGCSCDLAGGSHDGRSAYLAALMMLGLVVRRRRAVEVSR